MNTLERSYDHIYYKTGPVVQEEVIFKFRENIRNFVIISKCKKVWPFLLNKLNSSLPKDAFLAKSGWNWPRGSGNEDFLHLPMYFRYFVIISPWKIN